MCSKFQLNWNTCLLENFAVCEIADKEFYKNMLTCISKRPKGFLANLECDLPCVKANSIVNFVPFGIRHHGAMDPRENLDFVVPVIIPSLFARAPFSWAARHTMMCLDFWFSTYVLS